MRRHRAGGAALTDGGAQETKATQSARAASERVRTLLALAVAIGTREGLLGAASPKRQPDGDSAPVAPSGKFKVRHRA